MTIRPRGKSSSKPAPKCNIILDSGAYSAWRSGKPINLDEYCDYLHTNMDWIGHYVALDVINPGRPEEAAQASFDNYQYMRKRGLDPMPVFHVGEDISWLYRMLDAGCTYIGLSASSLVSRNQVDDWYALAFSHIVDAQGLPVVKAHAFGEGRMASIRKFPWASADSTSWVYSAQRTGQATLPNGRNVSMRNDRDGSKSSPDIDGLPPEDTAIWHELLAEAGIDRAAFAERGKVATVLRTYLTAMYYMRIQKDTRALQPIYHRARGFLSPLGSKSPACDLGDFNMHLVVGSNWMAWAIIAMLQHQNILISYFYVGKGSGSSAESLWQIQFKAMREFAFDPINMASTIEPFVQYWDILKEYVK